MSLVFTCMGWRTGLPFWLSACFSHFFFCGSGRGEGRGKREW